MHESSWEQGSAGPSGESCLDTPALCGAHHFPQPCPGTAGASQLCEGSKAALHCNPSPRPQPPWSQVLLAKCPGSAHSKVGWGQGPGAPWAGSGSHMQHNTVVLGRGLSEPLSCWGLSSSQPQAPSFLTPGHLCLLLFLMAPGWHHPSALCSPTTAGVCLLCLHHTATAQASRHGPRTAEGCPSDSLPAGQQVTGTVGTAPGSVPPQAHSHCPCRAPRALAQRSAKHVRRELHRSDGQHSPLAPFEAMGRSSSNCSESQTWLLSMGPTGMVLA